MSKEGETNSGSGSVLFVVVLGTFMVAVDTTVVILALPTIGDELRSNLSTVTWVLMAYLLVTAILATQLGRVGDILGRKTIYNSGFAVFTLGSALCGFSLSSEQLIAFRIVQGIGGAMLLANSGAVIADNFPRNTIGRAFGYTALGWNAGATIGIVLGGVITSLLGWRYIFLINVPIGIVATYLGYRRIRVNQRHEARIDYQGLAIFSVMLTLLSLGATYIAAYGTNLIDVSMVLACLLLFAPFYFVEKNNPSPMIQFDSFKQRVLSYSLLSSLFQSIGYLSVGFLITMYLQGIRGLDPLHASLLLLPSYVISSAIAPFAGRLSDRFGSRIFATTGLAIMIVSVVIYMSLSVSSPLYIVLIASVIGGIGSALFYPANNSAIMANAPPKYYGTISGLTRTLANVGTLISYILTITVSSLAIPRELAFQVFLGTSDLLGGLSSGFIYGLRTALIASAVVLFAGMILSSLRGKEYRSSVLYEVSLPSRTGPAAQVATQSMLGKSLNSNSSKIKALEKGSESHREN